MGQQDPDSGVGGGGAFVHLHTHTAHSKLDGLSRLDDLAKLVADDGAPAAATTDHGNLDAAWHWDAAARKAGIKPIHGIEAYIAIASEADMAKGNHFGSRARQDSIEVEREEGAESDADLGETSGKTTKTKRYEHLTLLAASPQGWANLVEINNDAQDDVHLWYQPRTDFSFLARRSEGLIALSGCLGGPVASRLLRDDIEGADRQFAKLQEVFGEDNVYVEIMEHGIAIEQKVTQELIALAKRFFGSAYRERLVATNDAHYLRENDADAHDHWLCIGQKKGQKAVLVTDEKRFKFNGSGYHVRSAAEMRALFDDDRYDDEMRADWAAACDNTLVIAERIADNVFPEPYLRLPLFPIEKVIGHPEIYGPDVATYTGPTEGEDGQKRFLRHLIRCGAKRRYGDPYSTEVSERLNFETPVIEDMGFARYFLSTWELITWARSVGIRVGPGRGSAAGCAVSYTLGIVNVDPIANRLLFERFLKMDRAKMPDVDIDFDREGAVQAVAHLADFWGDDRVARIGTWGMSRSKKAIKDVARVSNQVALGNELAKLVPDDAGKPLPFAKLLDPDNQSAAAFRAKIESTEGAAELVDMAAAIEDVVAGQGIHACGVLVSDQPFDSLLEDDWATHPGRGLVPLRYDRRKDKETNKVVKTKVTQWDGKAVEKFGFNKVDVLRLRTLDIVSEAVRLIEETTGETVDADNTTMDPSEPRVKAAWDLLSSGKTAGVFQVESPGMTRLCEQIEPGSLDDMSAIVALFRPGPLAAKMDVHYAARKRGEEPVDYGIFTHIQAEQDVIASVLGDTYGVILYQEQLMQLSDVVAGFDAEWRNRLQAAFSKKIRSEMEICGEAFAEGAAREIRDDSGNLVKIPFAQKTIETLWETFRASADYLFNKSHSAAYGYLSYITAYLKANWPSQYGAAMLSCTKRENSAARLAVLNSLRAEGIVVLPPSVNEGTVRTTAHQDGNVRIGLSEIKDVGSSAVHIINERNANGRFISLHDLMTRVKIPQPEGKVAKMGTAAVEGLIEAGALDSFGPRMGLMMVVRSVYDRPDMEIPEAEWGALERSARERDRLGVILGDHPLVALREQVKAWRVPGMNDEHGENLAAQPRAIGAVNRLSDRADVLTLGVLSGWAEKSYSRGQMVNLTLEGSNASISGTAWDETVKDMVARDITPAVGQVVAVRGRLNVTTITASATDIDDEDFDGEVAEVTERRELTVWQIYPVEMEDDPEVIVPEPTLRADLSLIIGGKPENDPEPTRDEPVAATLFSVPDLPSDVDVDPPANDVDAPAAAVALAPPSQAYYSDGSPVPDEPQDDFMEPDDYVGGPEEPFTDDFDRPPQVGLLFARDDAHDSFDDIAETTPAEQPVAVRSIGASPKITHVTQVAPKTQTDATAQDGSEITEILLKIDEQNSYRDGRVTYFSLAKAIGSTLANSAFSGSYGPAAMVKMQGFVQRSDLAPGDRSEVFVSMSGTHRCRLVAEHPSPRFAADLEVRVQKLAQRRRSA